MKILVLGAGAIGGYFGGRLAQAGADVTFLVREKRQAQLQRDGLQIKSVFGNYSGEVNTIRKEEVDAAQWDLVILSCKAYSLDSAIDAIRPAVSEHTAILPLLNGIAHLDRLNSEFGQEKVLGGLAKIIVALDSEGTINHMNDWCYITFGEQNGELSDRVRALQALFPAESVKALAVADIMQKMWEKLVHLATVAGVASLMRASVGEVVQVPGGTELFIYFLESNAKIAEQEGHPISEDFLGEYRQLFQNRESTYVPSLLRDIERRNPTEGQHIVGFMRERAEKYGMDSTLYRLMDMHVRAYEVRLAANRFD
jgi:2-dehydropantoate 2-reductase